MRQPPLKTTYPHEISNYSLEASELSMWKVERLKSAQHILLQLHYPSDVMC